MLTTHRHDRRVRRQTRFFLESLDDRLVLSVGAWSAAAEAVVQHPGANHAQLHQYDHHTRRGKVPGHGSPATLPLNVSPALRSLFREYKEQGGGSRFAPSPTTGRPLQINGTKVVVIIKVAFPPPWMRTSPASRRTGCKSSAPCQPSAWPKARCRSPRCRPQRSSRRKCGRLPRRA